MDLRNPAINALRISVALNALISPKQLDMPTLTLPPCIRNAHFAHKLIDMMKHARPTSTASLKLPEEIAGKPARMERVRMLITEMGRAC